MRTIRRVGAPSIRSRISADLLEIAVSLDSPPAAAWLRFFRDTESWSGARHPLFVDIKGTTLLFETSEEQLPGWVEDLDRWINTANQACTEMFV